MVLIARNLHRPELGEMAGDKLGIQQAEPAQAQADHQMHQRHLGSIPRTAEHALAKEGAPDGHAIQTAHQRATLPAFDGMAVAHAVQFGEQMQNIRVDPGIRPASGGCRAAGDGGGEITVGRDFEQPGANRAAQATGQMEGIQRQNPALFRIQPIKPIAVAGFRHGEHPLTVSLKNQFGGYPQGSARHGGSIAGHRPLREIKRGNKLSHTRAAPDAPTARLPLH